MSRLVAALLAALLAAGPAVAQTPAPAVDPGTKLAFPATLGGATLTRSIATPTGSATYQYAANGMEITIDVYGGDRRVPNGSSHPTIINQFSEEMESLRQQSQGAGLTGFEKPAVPSACSYGNVNFRCSLFSAASPTAGRIFGKILLMGYRERFLKIVIQWAQKSGQTAAEADKVLNAFVPALVH